MDYIAENREGNTRIQRGLISFPVNLRIATAIRDSIRDSEEVFYESLQTGYICKKEGKYVVCFGDWSMVLGDDFCNLEVFDKFVEAIRSGEDVSIEFK